MSPVYFLGLFALLKWIRPLTLSALVLALVAAFYLPAQQTIKNKNKNPLDFLKKMDPERHRDIVAKQKAFDREYMYILGERRPCHQGISTLQQLREETIEVMDSAILTFPQQFRHIYGRNPDQELADAVEAFRNDARTKLEVVHRFCHDRHPDIRAAAPVTL